MKKLTVILAVAAALLVLAAAAALAATPKLPATFSGGNGDGSPVSFKLDKHGKATYALANFTCKQISGIGTVVSKHPSGKVKHGKITITYRAKSGTVTANVKMAVTFTSRTRAKGTVTFSSKQCTAPKITFTATAA